MHLIMKGLNYGPVPCSIQSDTETPFSGGTPVYAQNTTRAYGGSLFFEPVPLEMIYTNETLPQIEVSVGGLPTLCPNFNCNYTYVVAIGEITGTTLSGTTLTLTGTSLPLAANVVQISFGTVNCTIDEASSSDTTIVCTMTSYPMAGDWIAELQSKSGLIPNSAATTNVALVVTAVSPSTSLNYLGGDTLTITGTNFGTARSLVAVSFTDGSICNVTTVTSS